MSTKNNRWGKRLLGLSIMVLFLAALCLLGVIAGSIPSRAAQSFGSPAPALSIQKLYQQSIILIFSGDELFTPLRIGENSVRMTVNPGTSLEEILSQLEELGLVQHRSTFRSYLIYSGIDTRIQAGEYRFAGGMTEFEIAQALESPAPSQTTVSVLPGWRAEEISATFLGIGLELDPDEFLQIVESEGREGYLFPGSYPVEREISAGELVDLLYQTFLSQITPEMESQLQDQGLSIHQAVILASIIERETVVEEEMPQIASVFLNRLRADMNLAADPTIQYALGYNQQQGTWWTNPLSLEDLKLPSSYNTYENPGLPPGPICNPGLAALQSVAQPAETDFFYFRALCDGTGRHAFTRTFEEHLQNACP
ncbi:MAG: endolytic transglycosylase MltG [Anaerolineales bacterium]